MNGWRRKRLRPHPDDGGIFRRERNFAADLVEVFQRSDERAAGLSRKDRRGDGAIGLSAESVCAVTSTAAIRRRLAFSFPTLMDPFYAALVQRIELQALAPAIGLSFRSSQGSPEREAEAVATLMSIKSAGAIVVPLGEASRKDLYRQMATCHAACLSRCASRRRPARSSGPNNHLSMGLIVDYLLRSGAPPSYFDMPDVNQNARERREAYEASMRERGVEPRIFEVHSLDWDFERSAFEEASRLLKAASRWAERSFAPTIAVAFGVMAAACQSGLSVGRRSQPAHCRAR